VKPFGGNRAVCSTGKIVENTVKRKDLIKTAVQGFITAMLDFGLTTHNVSGIGCQYEKTLLLANDSVQR
jgi:hypothetical protein